VSCVDIGARRTKRVAAPGLGRRRHPPVTRARALRAGVGFVRPLAAGRGRRRGAGSVSPGLASGRGARSSPTLVGLLVRGRLLDCCGKSRLATNAQHTRSHHGPGTLAPEPLDVAEDRVARRSADGRRQGQNARGAWFLDLCRLLLPLRTQVLPDLAHVMRPHHARLALCVLATSRPLREHTVAGPASRVLALLLCLVLRGGGVWFSSRLPPYGKVRSTPMARDPI